MAAMRKLRVCRNLCMVNNDEGVYSAFCRRPRVEALGIGAWAHHSPPPICYRFRKLALGRRCGVVARFKPTLSR